MHRIGFERSGSARDVTRDFGLSLLSVVSLFAFGCSAGSEVDGSGGGGPGGPGGPGSGGGFTVGTGGEGGGTLVGDPKTCAEAAMYKTYIGCDFYPAVTANNVWSLFDFAVVVANAGETTATVAIERNGQMVTGGTVEPSQAGTFYLPWVPELKGPDADECGSATPLSGTVRATGGAFHLTSDVPVTVYQFSPLEYAPQGGPPGKQWGNCPADACIFPTECFSYSNDASLLLPSTALTNNYRIFGFPAWDLGPSGFIAPFVSVTGTQDGTNVTVYLSPTAGIQAGGGVAATANGGQATFTINKGEVVQLLGTSTTDFSGSLIVGDKPLQAIHGMPCVNIPAENYACDHIEEAIVPAETLGKRYFVTSPTGPTSVGVQHRVRLIGNQDGTVLSYQGSQPAGAPSSINAGQVVDLGIVSGSFEVVGDKEFGVAMFLLGSELIDPGGINGDPAQSAATPVEQYRTKYVFLAPTDYTMAFADIIVPSGATLTLDGSPVAQAPTPIAADYGIARVPLSPTNGGAHELISTKPVGLQVIGYGSYTSYQYPGGLNLGRIADSPIPK